MRTKMMVLAGLAALGLSSAALAGGGGGMRGGFGRLLEGVDLTEAQEEMVDQAREERREAREEMRADHEADRAAFEAELLKEKPDRAKLQKMLDQRLAAHAERARDDLDALLDVTATFTPEQRAQLAEAMAEAKERGAEGHGHEKGRGGSPDGGGRE